MTTNPHAPKSIRLVHGMNHTGLTQSALEIERSREFKRAFVESIAAGIGFSGVDPEIVAGSEPSASLTAYLETFGPDGHPPESETLRFLSDELAFRGGPSFGVGEQLMDACFWTPEGWIVVGGYVVDRDGQPCTIESAVAGYERLHGQIDDPAVRAELAAIRVSVQIEWETQI